MSDSLEQQWLEFAASDLAAAQSLSSDELYSHACFHAQQCVEKSLKAFLVAKTNAYPRIHDLAVLLTQCAVLNPSFTVFTDDCIIVDQYYMHSRYPGTAPSGGSSNDLMQDEAQHAIDAAEHILQFVTEKLKAS